MSKLFKLTGNFMSFEGWAEPDPAFAGEIVVYDDCVLHGYCDELYMGSDHSLGRERYLAGALAENGSNGNLGIAFFKLSNHPQMAPILYLVPDLESSRGGKWSVPSSIGSLFVPQGDARIKLEEVEFSKAAAEAIEEKFGKVDQSIIYNRELLKPTFTESCIGMLAHAN